MGLKKVSMGYPEAYLPGLGMRPRDPSSRGGKKVAPMLPTPLPRRSLSLVSGGGILPLEAVSCSRSTCLFLLVSVESDSLQ